MPNLVPRCLARQPGSSRVWVRSIRGSLGVERRTGMLADPDGDFLPETLQRRAEAGLLAVAETARDAVTGRSSRVLILRAPPPTP